MLKVSEPDRPPTPSRRICYPPGMSVRVSDPIEYKGLQTPASKPSGTDNRVQITADDTSCGAF